MAVNVTNIGKMRKCVQNLAEKTQRRLQSGSLKNCGSIPGSVNIFNFSLESSESFWISNSVVINGHRILLLRE
jgi:hypothetical protein